MPGPVIRADGRLRTLKRICADERFLVEANDLAALEFLEGRPFVAGHSINLYNQRTYPETQRYTHAVIVAYLRKKGIQPYTAQARQLVGIDVTPAMARASSGEKGKGGSSTGVAEASGVETLERAPVTRLSSRLAPRLSRRSESGSDVGSMPAGQSIVNQNRARFSGDGR